MPITPLCTALTSVKRQDGIAQMNAVRCKRWSCPVCSQINRRRVIALGVKARPTAMLTLTLSSKDFPDPDDAARELKRGLVALRKRIARAHGGKSFAFLAVFEKHKSGHPHLHLLIRATYLPVKELRAMWESITGSFMVDIRKIDTVGKAAFYVAKYVGKDLATFTNCKRWWRSHDFNEPANDNEIDERDRRGWGRIEADVRKMAALAKNVGMKVESDGPDRYRFYVPDKDWPGWAALAQGARHWYGS